MNLLLVKTVKLLGIAILAGVFIFGIITAFNALNHLDSQRTSLEDQNYDYEVVDVLSESSGYYDVIIKIDGQYYMASGHRTFKSLFFPATDVIYDLGMKLSIEPCDDNGIISDSDLKKFLDIFK